MTKEKISEIVVVEGKDDTKRLQQVLDVDTIETNGSALNNETLDKIKHAQRVRGVIVFTDPDFPGEKIRKQIMAVVPDAKHAFIPRSKGVPKKKHGSLGVEHASNEAIIQALKDVSTPTTNHFESDITVEDLIQFGLIAGNGSRVRREKLGELLNIGYTNGKQLKKRLSMFQITKEKFLEAMKEIIEGETNE
ncbi:MULTISPECIES: ribonuclease M5 [Enterococcaceae]|uniref:ribonuclease M5 n=1 Tax=Enterococcaceae TaxID=81852 RepID=UPI000E51B5BD|nr:MULTISPECIES: ribonuclease M5 [Enterococcaceae]MCI0131039.1 ribonuclease M5 [Vagococcus sp. CY53-2]RGI29338.1 ribonuclease M5 [Melissococcus sp. OM08-11BH]UNM89387.1 ribonuclease M5 [Vagococcus sp. CY52-2]